VMSSCMLQFELLDETLDLNQTHKYHLSIQADLDEILFALLDTSSRKYLGLKHYTFSELQTENELYDQMEKLIREDPMLRSSYSSVVCMHPDRRSTFLPAALFNRDHLKSYFEFNHPLKDLDELHYNYIRHIDAYLVFPLYHEIANLCLRSWVNASFYHPVAVLLEELLGTGNGLCVNLHFYGKHFDIIVNEAKQLKFHNNFIYRTEEDVLYFILFVFNRLGLDQESIPVYLSGKIDKFSGFPSLLRRYFGKLSFRHPPSEFIYPPAFDKLQQHIYLNLFKVYHCA